MRKMSRYFCFIPWRPSEGTTDHTQVTSSERIAAEGILNSMALACTSLTLVFTLGEMLKATNNFDWMFFLREDAYGKVYKGILEDGTEVAIKRGRPDSLVLFGFDVEIAVLSKLRHRHPHLVTLIGYCDEGDEAILVYEYMANGTLRHRLCGSNIPPLSWRQRLEICIGAAKGLHYLHTSASQSIIHRDFQSSSILLDDNLVAKVSDFGLSMNGPTIDKTHVTTVVRGTGGYQDPEYVRTGQLTEKSDVYSFGVVLVEVLCGRPVYHVWEEGMNLMEGAIKYQKQGKLGKIMDPALAGMVNPASLKWYWEAAEKCLAGKGVDRPSMGEVLWNLEFALRFHQEMPAAAEQVKIN